MKTFLLLTAFIIACNYQAIKQDLFPTHTEETYVQVFKEGQKLAKIAEDLHRDSQDLLKDMDQFIADQETAKKQ